MFTDISSPLTRRTTGTASGPRTEAAVDFSFSCGYTFIRVSLALEMLAPPGIWCGEGACSVDPMGAALDPGL